MQSIQNNVIQAHFFLKAKMLSDQLTCLHMLLDIKKTSANFLKMFANFKKFCSDFPFCFPIQTNWFAGFPWKSAKILNITLMNRELSPIFVNDHKIWYKEFTQLPSTMVNFGRKTRY